jgi:hypothetical protein
MTSILTAATFVLLSADVLTGGQMGNLSFKAPSDWARQSTDEGTTWENKEGTSKIELSVYPVNPKRDAKLCVDQLIEALGKDGWEAVKIGGAPAVWKTVSDYVGEGDKDKVEKNKVNTVTYVGCNGDTKWVLTMTAPAAAGPRYGPLLKRMVDSFKYGGGK